jgi:hypothetical protein
MQAELAKDEALVKNYDFPTERFTVDTSTLK